MSRRELDRLEVMLGGLSIFALADYEIQFAHEHPLFAVVRLHRRIGYGFR